jgi:DNA-binding NtrC family response regulator
MAAAKKRLLIAEDSMEVRTLLKRTLAREGFDVETAAHGRDAIEILRGNLAPFDMMISDIRMPEMDGEELLVEAKSIQPTLRVIMVTSYGTPSEYDALRRKGAQGLILKPFKIPDLLEVIERAFHEPVV